MGDLARAATEELTGRILPFWSSLMDTAYGGVYGRVDHNLIVQRQANKGSVLTCRSLWAFSAAYRRFRATRYLDHASELYQFVSNTLIDHEYGGVFWAVDHKGYPVDLGKHVYAQAFAIYALTEYYMASHDPRALQQAAALFNVVERRGFDPGNNAYLEQFDREWNEVPNEHLSENGVIASLTMNTHLHVLEAYTNLYRASSAPEVRERIKNLLGIFHERIYDPELGAFRVFFDRRWRNLIPVRSFGHDIEASWLIDDALRAIEFNNPEYMPMVIDVAYSVAIQGMEADGSLSAEEVAGRKNRTRVWWVQAEAIIGFLNAHERTGDDRFAALARAVWDFVAFHMVDTRPGGEWFQSIDPEGAISRQDIASMWKCPYHNVRLCLETIKRCDPPPPRPSYA